MPAPPKPYLPYPQGRRYQTALQRLSPSNDVKLVLNLGETFKFTHWCLSYLTCLLTLSSLKFTHECLFLFTSVSLLPKNQKIYSRAEWTSAQKGIIWHSTFFYSGKGPTWAPGPQPLSGANWGHKVHRHGLGRTIWALGPRSFIKTFGPLGPYPPCTDPRKKSRELTLFHLHDFSVRWGNFKLGHYRSSSRKAPGGVFFFMLASSQTQIQKFKTWFVNCTNFLIMISKKLCFGYLARCISEKLLQSS